MRGTLPLMPTLPNIAFTQLRALATPLGLRIEEDGAGFPVIHGKYGRVLWFDGDDLLVTADAPTWAKLDAIPGLRRHGDNAALFPPHAFAAVADVIRAHRRPTLTPEQARKRRQTRRAKQARRARA